MHTGLGPGIWRLVPGSAAIPACTAAPGPSALTVTFHFPLSHPRFWLLNQTPVLMTDRWVQPIEIKMSRKGWPFGAYREGSKSGCAVSAVAGCLPLWWLEVSQHRSHGEMGSKEEGRGVGMEERRGWHGRFGRRRGPGGRLKFEGKMTTVRTKRLKAAPRSCTALMSELEFGASGRLQRGGRCDQEPRDQGPRRGLWPHLAPGAEPLRSVYRSR